jgi:RNA polymerase sigma factor for flagellar operon FliA
MTELTDTLWQRYRGAGDLRARALLLDRYLGLVHHSAHQLIRRVSREIELDDLVGAGSVGLVQALEGFDPGRGLAFSTYAMPRIRGAMLDELRSHDWMPRSIRSRSRMLQQARADLQQHLGRQPDHEQVAERLGIDLPTYWKWHEESGGRLMLQLDQSTSHADGDETRLAEGIADPLAVEPGDDLDHAQQITLLREGFEQLAARDRLVLTLYYHEELNLRQIGEVLHVSESRISQIRTRALRRLRDLVEGRTLAPLEQEDAA